MGNIKVVASLRHLTRFTILSYIRRDHIDQLPLPKITINYLLEKQCYIESLEDFEEAVRERPPLEFRSRSAAMLDLNANLTLQDSNNNNTNDNLSCHNSSNNHSSSTSERSCDSLATVRHINN
ncbi:unnamed protein product [Schistosoma turkestanicum]|nr:unnamed protein product [Schistosoma turkestanicum]